MQVENEMKRHLIKYSGDSEVDYYTTTYCKLNSDSWSEKFSDNTGETLTDNSGKCTCKKCLKAYKKERRINHDKNRIRRK